MGVQRIILSRELSLDEIEKIQKCPTMEIEVFVHGALCIAYSGRCLLSGYFNRRDPNQGTCTNAAAGSTTHLPRHAASDTGEVIPIAGRRFQFRQKSRKTPKRLSRLAAMASVTPLQTRSI